jgi:hypothetical protein
MVEGAGSRHQNGSITGLDPVIHEARQQSQDLRLWSIITDARIKSGHDGGKKNSGG